MRESRFLLRKNIKYSVLAFSINLALVFFSYRLVILNGGVAALGLWSTLMAWIYLIRLGDVGMASATTRFVALRDLRSEVSSIRIYVDTGILTNGALFAALSFFGLMFFYYILHMILPFEAQLEAKKILPLVFLGFFLSNLSGLVLGVLQGLHVGYIAARLSITGTVLHLVVVIFLVPKMGLAGLAWGLIAQYCIQVFFGWILIQYKIPGPILPVRFSLAAFREMFEYSVKVQASNIINGLFEPCSKILISRLGGLEVQGLYELAYKTVALPRNAVMAGAQATLPATTGLIVTDPIAVKQLYAKVLKFVTLSTLVVLLLVVVTAPLASWLWLGRIDFLYWIFSIFLAIGFLGNTRGAPAYNLGLASGRLRYNFLSTLISIGVMLAGGFLLSSVLGPIGGVAAVAVGLISGGIFVKSRNETMILGR